MQKNDIENSCVILYTTANMNLDIVALIEKNPLTRLNKDYQSILITKIKERFSENQQQLFVASFFCYLNYNSKNDFVIDLETVWKFVGFSRKDPAKVILTKHFTIDIDYKIVIQRSLDNLCVGRPTEQIMMTINTFKKFCLKAGTKKADEIHDYYIKLEELLQETMNDESNELKLQLENRNTQIEQHSNDLKIKEQEHNESLNKEKELERQRVLLSQFATVGCIIYIAKIKSLPNGEYVIKIGESRRGITNRFNEHKSNYEETLLLDCFAVNKSKDFESFLHNHELIKPNRVTDLIGHSHERELFLIGKHISYVSLINIINKNIKYFNDSSSENEIEKLRLQNENIKLQIESGRNVNSIQIEKLQKSVEDLQKSNIQILEKLNSQQTRLTTGFNQSLVTLGPRLQKINPETMQLIKVYETVTECMNEDNKLKRPSLNKAVIENTVYHGFRWVLVDRELDASILSSIESTKVTKIQHLGYIAKLNMEKTVIMNVYLDRKTASVDNGYPSSSSLDTPVKNFALTNGNYYIVYDSCDDDLKNDFMERHNGNEPVLYKCGVGQFNSENQMVMDFICKYDCLKQLKMSDKTLAKALDKDVMYNNYYFRSIGSKLKI